MRLAYRSELGLVRRRNEDAFLVPHPDVQDAVPWVVAVCDGMGGHPAGDVASTLAVSTVGAALGRAATADDLRTALLAAHEVIVAAGDADAAKYGLGSTAVVAVVSPEQVVLAHVGDSRAYLIRDAEAVPLTIDHNRGGYLTQSLGHPGVDPELSFVDVVSGDRLLLCTDGLTGLVPDDDIGALAATSEFDAVCDRLVDAALTAGGHDNITVVLVEV